MQRRVHSRPNFEDFGNVFGEKSSLVSFSKLMEEGVVEFILLKPLTVVSQ